MTMNDDDFDGATGIVRAFVACLAVFAVVLIAHLAWKH
jgi:hypothetical protein